MTEPAVIDKIVITTILGGLFLKNATHLKKLLSKDGCNHEKT